MTYTIMQDGKTEKYYITYLVEYYAFGAGIEILSDQSGELPNNRKWPVNIIFFDTLEEAEAFLLKRKLEKTLTEDDLLPIKIKEIEL